MIIYFDGDDVSSALELLLLNGDVAGAREYSQLLSRASALVGDYLAAEPGVEIILAGGDDIVVCLRRESAAPELIERVRKAYRRECGRSMSVGVGDDSREAVINLRQAKLMGRNRVVGMNEEYGLASPTRGNSLFSQEPESA
jgi:hypothetical protein